MSHVLDYVTSKDRCGRMAAHCPARTQKTIFLAPVELVAGNDLIESDERGAAQAGALLLSINKRRFPLARAMDTPTPETATNSPPAAIVPPYRPRPNSRVTSRQIGKCPEMAHL
jgi:hypothetical protein